jgi:hypothetical protein
MQHFKALMDKHPEIDQAKFVEQLEKFKAMGAGASGH